MILVVFLVILLGILLLFKNAYQYLRALYILKKYPINFNKKLVWITGASSGIGEALAIRFSQLGADLILSSRNQKTLEAVKGKCNKNSKIEIVTMDLSDPRKSKQIIEEYLQKMEDQGGQPINIVIHNAGVSMRSLFLDFSYENHEYMVNLNLNGPFAITQPLAKYMIRHNPRNERNGSQFVTISSIAGKLAPGMRSTYGAVKAGLAFLFDSLRAEFTQYNIKVTQIFPGYIRSFGSRNALVESAGERLNGTDDSLKTSMDLDIFTDQCLQAIYLEDFEACITVEKIHILGIYLKQFWPELFQKIVQKHLKKTQEITNIAKEDSKKMA